MSSKFEVLNRICDICEDSGFDGDVLFPQGNVDELESADVYRLILFLILFLLLVFLLLVFLLLVFLPDEEVCMSQFSDSDSGL